MRNDSQTTAQRNGRKTGQCDDELSRRTTQPRWDRPVDLRQHPPLDMAPVDPIDWSRYIASRMNAYEHAL